MFRTIKRIIGWAKEYKARLYIGFVCSFLTTWCTAGPVFIAAWMLDKIIKDSQGGETMDGNLVLLCFGGVVACILLRFFFSYWKNRLQESIGHEIAVEQRIHIGNILKRVSLGYFAKTNIGEILSALTTELSVLELQGMKMVDAIVNGYINVAAIICSIAFFSPLAAVIAIVGILLSSFVALRGINRQSSHTAGLTHIAQENLSKAAIEYVRGLPVVKSFGQESVSVECFRDASAENKGIRIKNEFGFVPWNCLHLFFMKASAAALVLVASWQTFQGDLSFTMLITISMFSFTIFGSIESINDAAYILSVIDSAMDKIERIEQADYIDENGQDIAITNFDIAFDKVIFGYEKREVLHDVSLHIPQNTTTAIVGPSGSGKTTICNLIARFYDVQKGVVTVGGRNVKDFTCDALLRNISMVFQNVYLFHDTIRNNILFGNPNATEDEMFAAAKAARCHDFIATLPDGYDTLIGEGGSTLSGGEKQRISIARAMLKNAPIVILDEATASVDPENEHLIQQAISNLTEGKTIIVIAHRLATIENADQILVVDGGRITQQGTHKELIKQSGLYQHFIQIREKAEGWAIG